MLTASRLDLALVERALAPSRERAQSLIAAGLVEVDGQRARSAAQRVGETAALRVTGRDHPWAGRGGLKLDAAMRALGVSSAGRVCLDAGASTGGFTDVLLAGGATLVHAVDVGHGLLDPRLAGDPRVHVMDGTNLRTLAVPPDPAPDLVTLDLAFISLRAVLPNLCVLTSGAEVVALFKPQFEVGRAAVSRGGIVRDQAVVTDSVRAFLAWAAEAHGVASLSDPVPASVRGAKGNQEWFVHVRIPAVPGS